MIFSDLDALYWIEKIIALAVILQTIELLQIRKTMTDQGVWRWEVMRREFEIFPAFIQRILEHSLRFPNFIYLLVLRLLSAVLILFIPHPILMFVLLISTILISLRWRGTFNGGSDFMTLIVLSALCVATSFENYPELRKGCLWYITIQTCTSYFIGGLAKLQKKNWRTGRALIGFMNSSIYGPPMISNPALCFIASWFVIIFECSFPLALLSSEICLAFVGIALIFHFMNFYIFGLNRFLFAWAAAYPALYYCSTLGK